MPPREELYTARASRARTDGYDIAIVRPGVERSSIDRRGLTVLPTTPVIIPTDDESPATGGRWQAVVHWLRRQLKPDPEPVREVLPPDQRPFLRVLVGGRRDESRRDDRDVTSTPRTWR